MEKWSSKKQMPKWLTPVLFSIFIHVIIVAILVQQHLSEQTSQQKTQVKKPIKAIKSYLIVAKPKVKKVAVKKVEPKKAPTKILPKPKKVVKETIKKESKPTPPPEKKKVAKATPAKTKEPIQSSSVVEQPNPQTPPPSSMMIIKKKSSGISAARDYLNQNQSIPPTSWQEHQFEQTKNKLNEQVENEKAKKYDGKFTPDISGTTDLGKTGDGSQLIKSGDACYVIQKNSFGDSVWLGTPCPLSTDPLRQAYRKSMDKYLKKKN
jgi:hypothetical protein